MIKHKLLTILLLSSTIGGALLSGSAMSGEFDMFSFFSKKSVSTTSIHASVGTELTELSDFPTGSPASNPDKNQCQKVKVQLLTSKTLTPVAANDKSLEVNETGFTFHSSTAAYAFVNNPDEFRFELWSTDQDRLKKIVAVKGLEAESSRWVNYSIVDVACLTKGQLLVAINYHDPRPKLALYLYEIDTQAFSLFTQSETNAQDHYDYFQQLHIDDEQSLIKYYSGTKRKSAEIYHNYFNHVVLFNKAHPKGLEVLKLGIEDGNIQQWQVVDKHLLLHTRDNREHKSPITKNWSLDLSRVLTQ